MKLKQKNSVLFSAVASKTPKQKRLKLSTNSNGTETQNGLKTVLFQFRFNVRTDKNSRETF